MTQQVQLDSRRHEIRCEHCGHSVPMFDRKEMDAINMSLALEQRKMLIALAFFAGALFLFGVYVFFNMSDYLVTVNKEVDGAPNPYTARLVDRDASSITVEDIESGMQQRFMYADIFKSKINALLKERPHLNAVEAAELEGWNPGNVTPLPKEEQLPFLFYFAIAIALAAVIFGAIASQERLVCEF